MLLVRFAAALLLCGAACSPLDRAPGQLTLTHGWMLALRVEVDKP